MAAIVIFNLNLMLLILLSCDKSCELIGEESMKEFYIERTTRISSDRKAERARHNDMAHTALMAVTHLQNKSDRCVKNNSLTFLKAYSSSVYLYYDCFRHARTKHRLVCQFTSQRHLLPGFSASGPPKSSSNKECFVRERFKSAHSRN